MATTRTRMATIALLAVAALGLTACTESSGPAGDDAVNSIDTGLAANIDAAVDTALQLSHADSAVVGIWTASGDYVRGYGEGVSAAAPIRAAQASQPVMCAALLSLVDAGKIKLDREVSKDLPRQLGIEGITYRQLCDSTSGLADFKTGITDIFANNPTRPWTDGELFAYALARSPLADPGTALNISDTGSLLLAQALRQVGGVRVDKMLEEQVFVPAGMNSTWYPAEPLAHVTLPSNGLTGFTFPAAADGSAVCTTTVEHVIEPEGEGEEATVETETIELEPTAVPEVSPSMLQGAGATVTTVTDLKRFYERYLSGGFGPSETSTLATTLAEPTLAEGEEAAAEAEGEPRTDGWTFGLEKHSNLYGMSGKMTGTLTAAYHDPASGFTVVVALNNSSPQTAFVRTLAFQLAAIAGAEVGWTAEDQAATLTSLAICQPPAEEEPAE